MYKKSDKNYQNMGLQAKHVIKSKPTSGIRQAPYGKTEKYQKIKPDSFNGNEMNMEEYMAKHKYK